MRLYAASEAVSNCDIICDILRFVLFLDEGDNQIVATASVVEMTCQSGVVNTHNNWSICVCLNNYTLYKFTVVVSNHYKNTIIPGAHNEIDLGS